MGTSLPADHTSATAAAQAHRRHWDDDADRYHRDHAHYVDGFYWCPEMLDEAEARLLGDVRGARVLEIGCGSAGCARWLAQHSTARLVAGIDLSREMLRHAPATEAALVQGDALHLPFSDAKFDVAFSAFGALPFLPDATSALREIRRVLRPGAAFVFSVNHPMRWVFPDDPGPAGLTATYSYFDRVYEEHDASGQLTYSEYHRTFSDWITALTAAGFRLEGVVEPEWPAELTETWGQWSPLRGRLFPGTIIFRTRADGS
ncbi:class I SAM-dependent methyltransferase [Corynebacterium uterequi]|uniref:Methyltransferase family protein n=1 Tax=Corynebacterium uterequi TaxID=1072256 RepID=A0A0G3HIK4_9CORY|nr:class I SAM-dependent methyltransferase [Corynebacterium uterequi]AKK10992.1 methyltransferase family protein [Corynebacterium uterequi]